MVLLKTPKSLCFLGPQTAIDSRHDLALAQILRERPEVVPSVHRLEEKCLGLEEGRGGVGGWLGGRFGRW